MTPQGFVHQYQSKFPVLRRAIPSLRVGPDVVAVNREIHQVLKRYSCVLIFRGRTIELQLHSDQGQYQQEHDGIGHNER